MELTLFWYWPAWLMSGESALAGAVANHGAGAEATALAPDPVAGARWHAELRRAADAWRELAGCDHRAPGPEHERARSAQRARRDQFVAEVSAA